MDANYRRSLGKIFGGRKCAILQKVESVVEQISSCLQLHYHIFCATQSLLKVTGALTSLKSRRMKKILQYYTIQYLRRGTPQPSDFQKSIGIISSIDSQDASQPLCRPWQSVDTYTLSHRLELIIGDL